MTIRLQNHLEYQIRDEYLELMEKFLRDTISISEFCTKFRIKKNSLINSVTFFESNKMILLQNEKSSRFGELLETVTTFVDDYLRGQLDFPENQFKYAIETSYIAIKKHLNE